MSGLQGEIMIKALSSTTEMTGPFTLQDHLELIWYVRGMFGLMIFISVMICLKAWWDCEKDKKKNKYKQELRDARNTAAANRLASRSNQVPLDGDGGDVCNSDFASRNPLLAPALDGFTPTRATGRRGGSVQQKCDRDSHDQTIH